MHESTQWLEDAAVAPALPGLLAGLVCRLRVVLNSGWTTRERITAITEELDGLAPPPPPDPADGPVFGQASIGRLLATSTSPATMLFSAIAGAPVTFAVWTDADVTLTAGQCTDLDAEPGTRAAWRRGTFKLDGQVLADVTSVVLPGRLPSESVAALAAGTPLGAVIAATGHREPLSVLPYGGGLQSSALMWARGRQGRQERIALAEEIVHPWFCQRAVPAAALQRVGQVPVAQVAQQVGNRLVAGPAEPAAPGVQVRALAGRGPQPASPAGPAAGFGQPGGPDLHPADHDGTGLYFQLQREPGGAVALAKACAGIGNHLLPPGLRRPPGTAGSPGHRNQAGSGRSPQPRRQDPNRTRPCSQAAFRIRRRIASITAPDWSQSSPLTCRSRPRTDGCPIMCQACRTCSGLSSGISSSHAGTVTGGPTRAGSRVPGSVPAADGAARTAGSR